ncbi:hypothetical protein [Petropleomorpha daqingensis]|uniref:Cell wall-active antibiotics response 4TMS YvqF n=1 Tax=Petropleomorpha daqingensis TaxID=2026353 RepID=A0A853CDR0_9ACTN|nr:hypothetical protein [Petropleomorpha daqingensis]NYJ05537.1 hypothetical protein [Petropleomorpha daqingensis]
MAVRILRTARRLLPWLAGWLAFQGVVAVAGRVLAARFDEGDDSSTEIRRVFTMGGLQLTPTNPEVSRIEMDLGMAGGEIDLTGLKETNGIDLTVRAVMGGVAVKVPPDWRVWSQFRGVGGIGTDGGLTRCHDEHNADLRVRALAVFGGIGVEAG